MIEWNDIEKGQLPVKGEEVLWYPSLCFGSIDENGIVSMDSNMGWWDDLAYGFNQYGFNQYGFNQYGFNQYGFNQPEKHRHKLPLEVVQYWTEVNHP